jgi:hypothetical protein
LYFKKLAGFLVGYNKYRMKWIKIFGVWLLSFYCILVFYQVLYVIFTTNAASNAATSGFHYALYTPVDDVVIFQATDGWGRKVLIATVPALVLTTLMGLITKIKKSSA